MKFEELVDIKHWQNIQDILSEITGLSLKTMNTEGEILIRPSRVPDICAKVIANCPPAVKKCWQWFPSFANYLNSQDNTKYYDSVCSCGLVNYAIPLVFENKTVSYFILGPVVLENIEMRCELSVRVRDLDLDEAKFFESFSSMQPVNTLFLKQSVELLKAVSSFIAKLSAFSAANSKNSIMLDQEKIKVPLNYFLELAMKICSAELGSVMVFEKKSQELSIKEAKGLSEDVINNTKIKPGEGIAGMSIKNKKSLFLSDELKDRELRLRMRRPKVKSAFVIPVFYKDEVLGVISVATARYPNKFSDKLMQLLNELIEITLVRMSL